MPQFLYVYHNPANAYSAGSTDDAPSDVMAEWMKWAEQVGPAMKDFGRPASDGMRVTADGVEPSTREVTGYTILEADSMEAAVELAKVHPHLTMPGGCEIEVHQLDDVPS